MKILKHTPLILLAIATFLILHHYELQGKIANMRDIQNHEIIIAVILTVAVCVYASERGWIKKITRML